MVVHSLALGKSSNLSAPSLQNVKQLKKEQGEFISLVERPEQLGSFSAITTSFYLQDVGGFPHFTFDSQENLQVNGSSHQQSAEHSKSFWFAASRENVRDSSACYLEWLSKRLKTILKQVLRRNETMLYSFFKLRQLEICFFELWP